MGVFYPKLYLQISAVVCGAQSSLSIEGYNVITANALTDERWVGFDLIGLFNPDFAAGFVIKGKNPTKTCRYGGGS
jgi:hypothetical protein